MRGEDPLHFLNKWRLSITIDLTNIGGMGEDPLHFLNKWRLSITIVLK